jgi:hypothetical protein
MYNNRYKYWSENKEKLKNIDKNLSLKYSYFEDYYFANLKKIEIFFNLNRDQNGYSDTFDKFVKIFACDLVNESGDQSVWGKAVDICKPEPKPEPPKKITKLELINKYANAEIDPFVGGAVKELPDGNGYYSKTNYTDRYGRKGELRYYAPNPEGFAKWAFYPNDDLSKRAHETGNVKVSQLLESFRKRKMIHERHDKDLKVIKLLRVIRENHIQKKNFLNRSFLFEDGPQSEGQAKRSFEEYKKYFKLGNIDNWANNTQILEYIADVIIDLIDQGYKGNMFGYYRIAISLLSQITPGQLGVPDPEVASQIFSSITQTLNTKYASNKKAFQDPLPSEKNSGKYSEVKPISDGLENYFLYPVWRDKDDAATGPSKNPDEAFKQGTYRSNPQTEEACRTELTKLYDEAIGGFSNQESYCTTQTFRDRKNYINGCYNRGFFRQTPKAFTPDDKLYYEMYSDLYRGVVVINRRSRRKSEQRPLSQKECALKNK